METKTLINKLFTVNSINRLIFSNQQTTFKQSMKKMAVNEPQVRSNRDAIQYLYRYMGKNHRNEYFYKNTLLNKILLGRHSIRTSTAIKELPVDNNILDFLIINGVGQVYEIKTELDNLKRLNNQMRTYYKAFSYCNVVTDATHVTQVFEELARFDQVGIMVLTKRNTLHVVREPRAVDEFLSYETMFKILRKAEFEQILKDYFGVLPQTTPVRYYSACLNLFKQLSLKQAQRSMLNQLKERSSITTNNQALFNEIPNELKEIAYFSKYSDADFKQVTEFLDKKIGDE